MLPLGAQATELPLPANWRPPPKARSLVWPRWSLGPTWEAHREGSEFHLVPGGPRVSTRQRPLALSVLCFCINIYISIILLKKKKSHSGPFLEQDQGSWRGIGVRPREKGWQPVWAWVLCGRS